MSFLIIFKRFLLKQIHKSFFLGREGSSFPICWLVCCILRGMELSIYHYICPISTIRLENVWFQYHLQIKIIIKTIKWCSRSERDLLWVLQNLLLKNGTIFQPTLFMKIKCTSWQRKRFQVCKFYFLIQDIYLSLASTLPVHTIDVTAFYSEYILKCIVSAFLKQINDNGYKML